jgi:hypothetical protein
MNGNDRDAMDFDVGMAILSAYDASGFLGIGIDVYGGQNAGTSSFDAKFPYGTFGRPRDPDSSNDATVKTGATTLWAYCGKQRLAFVQDDPRVWPKLPQASKGTWGAYADTGQADITTMVLDGTTGSFALRVPHSGSGVSRVLVDVETPGAEQILLANGNGCELAVKSLETVIGDDLLALALTKDTVFSALKSALQVFAGAVSTATTVAQIALAGGALQGALLAIPVSATTKLRSE